VFLNYLAFEKQIYSIFSLSCSLLQSLLGRKYHRIKQARKGEFGLCFNVVNIGKNKQVCFKKIKSSKKVGFKANFIFCAIESSKYS
jgi:hypothetical protein